MTRIGDMITWQPEWSWTDTNTIRTKNHIVEMLVYIKFYKELGNCGKFMQSSQTIREMGKIQSSTCSVIPPNGN